MLSQTFMEVCLLGDSKPVELTISMNYHTEPHRFPPHLFSVLLLLNCGVDKEVQITEIQPLIHLPSPSYFVALGLPCSISSNSLFTKKNAFRAEAVWNYPGK